MALVFWDRKGVLLIEELKAAADFFLRESTGEWYDAGMKKLLARLQKCIDRDGDYVEK